MVRILVAVVVVLFAFPAAAQSFNCGGRLNASEQAVCASQELSSWDVQVAQMYGKLRYSGDGRKREAALRSQRAFLARRNRCGGNFVCILNAYEAQAGALNGIRKAF